MKVSDEKIIHCYMESQLGTTLVAVECSRCIAKDRCEEIVKIMKGDKG